MARSPSKPKKNEPFDLHLIIPGDIALALDAEAKRLSQEAGIVVTRSDIARRALTAYVTKEGGR